MERKTLEEIKVILDQHHLMLKTNRKPGTRADLSYHDFSDLDLSGLDFSEVNLEGANFSVNPRPILKDNIHSRVGENTAILKGTKFNHANLRKAVFFKKPIPNRELRPNEEIQTDSADVTNATFHDADLTEVDLSELTTLTAHQLARANLTNAKLPDTIGKFESGLNSVTETTKNAKHLYQIVLAASGYLILTMATSTPISLLIDDRTPLSPLHTSSVPYSFALVWGIILYVFFYIYSQIHLIKVMEKIGQLPAVFPDGLRVNQKITPWLTNELINSHIPWLVKRNLKKKVTPNTEARYRKIKLFNVLVKFFPGYFNSTLAKLQWLLIHLLNWWIVPVIIIFVWGTYIKTHKFLPAMIHMLSYILAVYVSIIFIRRTKRNLSQKLSSTLSTTIMYCLPAMVLIFMISFTYVAIYGSKKSNFEFLYLNIDGEDLSVVPTDWDRLDSTYKNILRIHGRNFNNRNLRFMILSNSNGDRSNFYNADLYGANISNSYFRNANFGSANFDSLNLYDVSLYDATIPRTISRSHFTKCDLTYLTLLDNKPMNTIIFKDDQLLETRYSRRETSVNENLPKYYSLGLYDSILIRNSRIYSSIFKLLSTSNFVIDNNSQIISSTFDSLYILNKMWMDRIRYDKNIFYRANVDSFIVNFQVSDTNYYTNMFVKSNLRYIQYSVYREVGKEPLSGIGRFPPFYYVDPLYTNFNVEKKINESLMKNCIVTDSFPSEPDFDEPYRVVFDNVMKSKFPRYAEILSYYKNNTQKK